MVIWFAWYTLIVSWTVKAGVADIALFSLQIFIYYYYYCSEDKRKYRMNNQTKGFFIVVCLFVDRFRSTKTFFKTKHNSEKFPEVLKNR